LRLAEKAYMRTQSWGALQNILPAMKKNQLGDATHRLELQQQCWLGLMNQAMADQGSYGLKRWWQNLCLKTRIETALEVAMAVHLIVCDDH
ncbi:protoheme IX biogenesis protein HemY, partial [Erwinia amylovora]|nr:protoheme IX biogenesis protein HemY [Erwinia amylovora]